jgi:hypothetical protein
MFARRVTIDERAREIPRVTSAAMFELSGVWQTHYVSMWHLFANRESFHRCVEMFAVLVRDIRRKFPFQAVVTATAAARHLVDAAHARIEERDEVVSVKHLGEYPFDQPDARPIDFAGQRVLVVCDVIQTGRRAERLVNAVSRWGGEVVGVACVARLNPAKVSIQPTYRRPDIGDSTIRSAPRMAYVFSLCDLNIPTIDPKAHSGQPIPVHPSFPPRRVDSGGRRYGEIGRRNYYVQFTDQEMLNHLEISGAIDFDLFHVGRRKFMTAVRLPLVLRRFQDEIWTGKDGQPGIRNAFVGRRPVVVTTYRQADQQFRDFIVERLAAEGRSPDFVLIPEVDELEPRYELLPGEEARVRGRDVVILLASVQTPDKVQGIAARLAMRGVARVTVVCLLNRLGPHATEFLAGIERLLRGIRRADQSLWYARALGWLSRKTGFGRVGSHAPFRFWAVYNILELPTASIDRMQHLVYATLTRFRQRTRVPAFQSWADHERKYFEARPVTTAKFLNEAPVPLPDGSYQTPGGPIIARTKQGRLAALSHHIVTTRQYDPIIKLLDEMSDKEDLYRLFGLMLPDVYYLKCVSGFDRLRQALTTRITKERQDRIALELDRPGTGHIGEIHPLPDTVKAGIENRIRLEAHLLFGLTLFAAHDPEFDYRPIILDRLDPGPLDPEGNPKAPHNLLLAFWSDTFVWSIAALLHATERDVGATSNSPFKNEVRERLRRVNEAIDAIRTRESAEVPSVSPSETAAELDQLKQQAKTYLDHLRAELGDYEALSREQIIRYLHRHILGPKRNHNFIINHLRAAAAELTEVVRTVPAGDEPPERRAVRRVEFPPHGDPQRKKIQVQLGNALYAAGVLQDLSLAVRRLYLFTPADRKQTSRFTSGPETQGSFAAEVGRLRALLQEARETNAVSERESREVNLLVTSLIDDLWGEQSVVAKALDDYVTPLAGELLDALNHASEKLSEFPDVWRNVLTELRSLQDDALPVLVDRTTLKEVLRNALTNVRHSLAELPPHSDRDWANCVRVELHLPLSEPRRSVGEDEQIDYLELAIWSAGRLPPLGLGSPNPGVARHVPPTLQQQRLELGAYGGSWSLEERDEGVVAFLRFVSRHRLHRDMISTAKRAEPSSTAEAHP